MDLGSICCSVKVMSRMPGWQPLGSFFPPWQNPSGDGKLGMFAVMLCLLT